MQASALSERRGPCAFPWEVGAENLVAMAAQVNIPQVTRPTLPRALHHIPKHQRLRRAHFRCIAYTSNYSQRVLESSAHFERPQRSVNCPVEGLFAPQRCVCRSCFTSIPLGLKKPQIPATPIVLNGWRRRTDPSETSDGFHEAHSIFFRFDNTNPLQLSLCITDAVTTPVTIEDVARPELPSFQLKPSLGSQYDHYHILRWPANTNHGPSERPRLQPSAWILQPANPDHLRTAVPTAWL